MKKIAFFMLFTLAINSVKAQDVIVKKDGNTILANVLEVNESTIKYKRQSNLDGPTYSIAIAEIMSINYNNGEKDDFSKRNERHFNDSSGQQYVKKTGDLHNEELLSLYNKTYLPNEKIKASKSKASKYILIFGVNSSSILSNEDIEMTWVKYTTSYADFDYNSWGIKLKNKSNKIIYVDKSNCFRVLKDGTSYCYYNNAEQITVNQGGGSGVSVGMGGIATAAGIGGVVGQIASGVTVGGGSSHSVSTTYNQQPIIKIPPMGQIDLSEENYITAKNPAPFSPPVYKLIEESEVFDFYFLDKASKIISGRSPDNFFLQKGLTTVGNTRVFDEKESPYTRKYTITYSTEADFKTYSSLECELYLHEIVGYNGNHPIGFGNVTFETEKYLKGYNTYTIDGYYKCE